MIWRCDEGQMARIGVNYGRAGGPRIRILWRWRGRMYEFYVRVRPRSERFCGWARWQILSDSWGATR